MEPWEKRLQEKEELNRYRRENESKLPESEILLNKMYKYIAKKIHKSMGFYGKPTDNIIDQVIAEYIEDLPVQEIVSEISKHLRGIEKLQQQADW